MVIASIVGVGIGYVIVAVVSAAGGAVGAFLFLRKNPKIQAEANSVVASAAPKK